ncbi:MAG: hypothetical protein ABWK05_00705 [Pyrobaculum sp.]
MLFLFAFVLAVLLVIGGTLYKRLDVAVSLPLAAVLYGVLSMGPLWFAPL